MRGLLMIGAAALLTGCVSSPSLTGTRGAPSDMEIQLREVMSLTRRMSEIIAHHSGQPLERVAQDIDRDYYMTSAEARDYGIVDDIILPRRGVAAPALVAATA